jgi:hypothetical protein
MEPVVGVVELANESASTREPNAGEGTTPESLVRHGRKGVLKAMWDAPGLRSVITKRVIEAQQLLIGPHLRGRY